MTELEHNLSNFPKEKDFLYSSNLGEFDEFACLEACYDWYKGIKKELEQLKQSLLNPDGTLKHTNCCDMTTIELVDEVLGVTKQ